MSKHARTTITVPAELKVRMDSADESINWSALACQAFEQKLAEIVKRKGPKNMTDVINRLRASKQAYDNTEYQSGYQAGQAWAKNRAEAMELMRLADHRSRSSPDWADWFHTGRHDRWAVYERFVFVLHGNEYCDGDTATDFWTREHILESPVDAFVHGFADGALSVWDEVKDEL